MKTCIITKKKFNGITGEYEYETDMKFPELLNKRNDCKYFKKKLFHKKKNILYCRDCRNWRTWFVEIGEHGLITPTFDNN
jgi:hypothetical protein